MADFTSAEATAYLFSLENSKEPKTPKPTVEQLVSLVELFDSQIENIKSNGISNDIERIMNERLALLAKRDALDKEIGAITAEYERMKMNSSDAHKHVAELTREKEEVFRLMQSLGYISKPTTKAVSYIDYTNRYAKAALEVKQLANKKAS